MPLHDVGYRAWEGAKSSMLLRWLIIAIVGIRLSFRTSWLSRTLFLSYVPAVGMAVVFFIYEQSIINSDMRPFVLGFVRFAGVPRDQIAMMMNDPAAFRHTVWSSLILVFMRYPQAILLLVVVGIVAPKLISYDLRNRGYLLYFSKPILIWEYILGKACVVMFFLGLIVTAPALLLYVLGLCFSPDIGVIAVTWDIPLRVLLASVMLMVPVSMVALCCSAITIESRFAAFTWFAFWVVGWTSYLVLLAGETAANPDKFQNQGRFLDIHSRWEVLSPYHTLGRLQQWVFGTFPTEHWIGPYQAIALITTSVSAFWIYRRIRGKLST